MPPADMRSIRVYGAFFILFQVFARSPELDEPVALMINKDMNIFVGQVPAHMIIIFF